MIGINANTTVSLYQFLVLPRKKKFALQKPIFVRKKKAEVIEKS